MMHRRLFPHDRPAGLVMLAAMLLALVAANSPVAWVYRVVHHTPVHLRIGPLIVDQTLAQVINHGLMALFFLVAGLEIKRQFREGHLAKAKEAALPAIAAAGGMIVPAALFLVIAAPDPGAMQGWAIPTATDIVLALGILALLGDRVPVGLKVFLTALAIFDDIGAVVLIGLFYGEVPTLGPLAVVAVALLALAALNRRGVVHPVPYVVAGTVLWLGMFESGIEPALAGILIALAVPMRSPKCRCTSPVRETERRLHPFCALGIVPLFAFFNAGVALIDVPAGAAMSPIFLGIIAGLFVGKQLGIVVFAAAAVGMRVARLPADVSWRQFYGIALLAGIGFTMSLFVARLAYDGVEMLATARLGIFCGSAFAAAIGLTWLHLVLPRTAKRNTNKP
jgi:NhaA family Na+:H+ antiporter